MFEGVRISCNKAKSMRVDLDVSYIDMAFQRGTNPLPVSLAYTLAFHIMLFGSCRRVLWSMFSNKPRTARIAMRIFGGAFALLNFRRAHQACLILYSQKVR